MIRKFTLLMVLGLALLGYGCSDGNSSAPIAGAAHPSDWIVNHDTAALAVAGFADCITCHGTDLKGSGDAVSCFSCHLFNDAPPFSIHPDWTDPYTEHRAFAAPEGNEGYPSCALSACHGTDIRGGTAGPSCFSATFDGLACHADGPVLVPHPIDGTYFDPANHGKDAKADLTSCQACHSDNPTGGPGSNPRFNVGIDKVGGNGCEPCHGQGYAHPQAWAGPNATFHYSAGNIQNACTLCHGANLDGAGGVGISCLGCHAETTNLTLDCAFCHGFPPDGSADLDVPTPVPHGNVADISLHDDCIICHGMKETATGGSFSTVSAYALFDKANDINGDHWDGNINMSGDAGYNENNFGCDAAGCHVNDAAHQLSDSGLPVELGAYGSGGGGGAVPHPLDGTYLDGANHGPDAKADLTICQACHSDNPAGGPGTNPRFNVGIGNAGGNGCEGCHGVNYAHPQTWAGPANDVFHYQGGNIDNACTLCHGVDLDGVGGVGISCLNCHAEVATFALDCTACHAYPPDGTTPEPRVADLGGQLVAHGGVAGVALHDQCAICHGVKSSDAPTSGALTPNANYRAFDPLTGTIGDHWNGQINMNGPSPDTGAGYNETDFGCDNAGCHANDADHRLSDSALTVQFGDYGSAGAPHALDGTFLSPAEHGATAKADLASCKACHGEATDTNPRYNVGINSISGTGCEGCHNDQTAHPSQGTLMTVPREVVQWYDVDFRHSTGAKATFATACGVCHPGIGGAGTVGPACTSCHVANPVVNNSGCVSCHNLPPNGGGIAGNVRPNRNGRHSEGAHGVTCDTCHGAGYGPGNANHFDKSMPATVIMTGDGAGITATQTATNTTCTGSCHGKGHNFTWY